MQPVAPRPAPDQPGDDDLAAEVVDAFLRRHPDWLAQQPGLYEALEPPLRVHGERLADHMAALLGTARSRAAHLAARAEETTVERRAAAGLAERVQAAVLALMHAADPVDCVLNEWPGLLGVDAAALCAEADRHGFRPLAPGAVEAALGRQPAVVRAGVCAGGGDPALHGEAAALAQVEAVVRVPLRGPPALLALACRDGRGLAGGGGALGFLGQAAAAALDRAGR